MGNIGEGNFSFSKQYFNSPKWCRHTWATGNGGVKHLLMKRLAVKQWGTMKFKVRFPDPIDTMIV